LILAFNMNDIPTLKTYSDILTYISVADNSSLSINSFMLFILNYSIQMSNKPNYNVVSKPSSIIQPMDITLTTDLQPFNLVGDELRINLKSKLGCIILRKCAINNLPNLSLVDIDILTNILINLDIIDTSEDVHSMYHDTTFNILTVKIKGDLTMIKSKLLKFDFDAIDDIKLDSKVLNGQDVNATYDLVDIDLINSVVSKLTSSKTCVFYVAEGSSKVYDEYLKAKKDGNIDIWRDTVAVIYTNRIHSICDKNNLVPDGMVVQEWEMVKLFDSNREPACIIKFDFA